MEIADPCLATPDRHGIDMDAADSRRVKSMPYATEEVWDRMQAIITRLYQSEDMSLNEVKGIMERDYCFYATQRMFKTRIVRWGLDKKLKEKEVMHMLKLKRQRLAAGKDSSFRVRGQNINWDRVEQYLKRRPDLVMQCLENNKHAPSQQRSELEIICRTPSPTPKAAVQIPYVPSLLEPTLHVELQENVMRIFKSHHTGAFESGVWVSEDINLSIFENLRFALFTKYTKKF
ncbi:uncharacterized protein ColSpa_05042 [Colletotrichum spaethianum]|uniref:Clr5 domain-containing protein n=1 Tax=Colletotrichum spaethianum TaxID=700344 RepID=A0AA37LA30_9PEZI|nr:uncharacterized protein ColSpa_05042 [Colletotrichum spaethianum]GKT44861.1 hypothetical protein ColSpa_05042 [Colletotrichum spaethianum]